MSESIYSCGKDETVSDCARLMNEKGIGFVPVCDESSAVIGTITDRDLALRVLATGKSFDTRIGDVMTTEVVACKPDDDLMDAEKRMADEKKSRILVLDDQNQCLGIISLSDIAQRDTDDHVASLLREVTTRESKTMQASP